MESAHKRKRSGTLTSHGDASSPVARSTSIWFDDGNIILQAENLMLRVHKSVLALHSSILGDMFLIPQPDSDSGLDSVVEGCPVVKMEGDSGREWEELLSLIYHGYQKARPNDTLSFSQISAMLRLGHKYSFKMYREEALARLLEAFGPSWDTSVINDTGTIDTDTMYMDASHSWSDVINLAHDLRLNQALPVIYFNAIAHKDYPAYLFEGTKSADGTISKVLPDIRRHLLCLQDALFSALRAYSFSWMFDDPRPEADCTGDDDHCSAALLRLIDRVYTPKISTVMALDLWPEDDDELCERCSAVARETFEEDRQNLWEHLPTVFGLPGWEMLEDPYA